MNLISSMRYLVALNEHRHFGRAAQACHITQPALSNALRALEGEFGAIIVKRGRTYAGLTHEGEQVLRTAQRMLQEHEMLRQELSHSAGHLQGSLRMAAVPTATPILSRFAAQLQARHPGIVPVVLSMSSLELETGLENLSLDLALGYTGRMNLHDVRLTAWPQYSEHYFLLRRAESPGPDVLRMAPAMTWREAASLPLCMLTPDMHNRSIIDEAFRAAGIEVKPAIETNSVLTLALSVIAGTVCSVLPGSLVAAVRAYHGLQAHPLTGPEVVTPIGFMTQTSVKASRALEAALELLETPEWQQHCSEHAGALEGQTG
ncbi:MAG: LysR substrate-binding domain-containing protein [Polaromonas sp.]|nr:LysR substrate-binding domain-containing protein [Polaromonas sp.]